MRIRPTQEQIDYLTKTVGVDPDTLGGSDSGPSPTTDAEPTSAPVTPLGRLMRSLYPLMLGVLIGLLLLLRAARGETSPMGRMDGELALEQNQSEAVMADRAASAETQPGHAVPTGSSLPRVPGDLPGREPSSKSDFMLWLGPALAAVSSLAGCMFLVFWILALRRIRSLEDSCRGTETEKGAPATMPQLVPVRPPAPPAVTPEAQMELIVRTAAEFPHIRHKPRLAEAPWSLGFATAKGNVRLENQDYGICFCLEDWDVMTISDGCGAHLHAQRAASLAATTSAVYIIRSLGAPGPFRRPDTAAIAEQSIHAAAHRLAVEGDKIGISEVSSGMRTTLIVLIRGPREYVCAYIGDGGAYVLRAEGHTESMLVPQKADGRASNVLAASLGPRMVGLPVISRLERKPGDLLIAGTDGIFDRIRADFPQNVLNVARHCAGDLNEAARLIVDQLADYRDAAGYICDDNLTLGIMADAHTSCASTERGKKDDRERNRH